MVTASEMLQRVKVRPDDALHTYWLALGRFIAQFASLEAAMQVALWNLTRVGMLTGRAVFSGVKADKAMGLLVRVADANKWDAAKKAELKYLIDQLGLINQARNDIVHYGASFDESDRLVVSNELFAHLEERVRRMVVSPEMLDAMTADVSKIQMHLVLFTASQEPRALFVEALGAAWQYKPARPPKKAKEAKGRAPRRGRP